MADYSYLIRRKVFKLFGADFHIYDPAGNLIGFSHQKAFKLKEDIRVFTDESMQQELLIVKARQIIDFSACYDIFEASTHAWLGTWQRKGFSSLLRDHWLLFAPNGPQIGEIKEDSTALALVRRFVDFGSLIPQHYNLTTGASQNEAVYSQRFNPFVFKIEVRLNPECRLNPYLVLAGGILLAAIEGRQG